MRYVEMLSVLSDLSGRYGTALQVLGDSIGYEYTEALLGPLFDYILPSKNDVAAEHFLKAIDEVAAKLFFYKESAMQDVYYSRIEDFVHNYKMTPEEKNEY